MEKLALSGQLFFDKRQFGSAALCTYPASLKSYTLPTNSLNLDPSGFGGTGRCSFCFVILT